MDRTSTGGVLIMAIHPRPGLCSGHLMKGPEFDDSRIETQLREPCGQRCSNHLLVFGDVSGSRTCCKL